MLNGFSVDVEEWFHICGSPPALAEPLWNSLPSRVEQDTARILGLLDRHSVRATFFVLGWVAQRYPRLVHAIASAGHVIGSHGHRHDRVYDLDQGRFSSDLAASLAALTDAGSGPVSCYRAPEWSINERAPWALDVLARAGITLNFTYDELSPLLGVDPARMYDAIRAVGPEHVTLSSDAGEPLFPNSVECMRMMRAYMRAFGLTAEEVDLVSVTNPAKIVGAPVLV